LPLRSQESAIFTGFDSISIATCYGWMAEVGFAAGARDIYVHYAASKPVHLASYPMVGGDVSPGINRPGREADHSSLLIPKSRTLDLYIHSTMYS
jgi:hypothetical protein